MDFNSLGDDTRIQIANYLSKYFLFCKYLNLHIKIAKKNQPWSNRGKIKLKNLISGNIYFDDYLSNFNSLFMDWINEMSRNKISFQPFKLDVTDSNIFEFVNSYREKRSFSGLRNMRFFDDRLNKMEREVGDLPLEDKFFEVFYKSVDEICNSRIKV